MSTANDKKHRRHLSSPNNNRPMPSRSHIALKNSVSTVSNPIVETPDYVQKLRSLVHSIEVLNSAGHVTEKLSDKALELKKRCADCGKSMSRFGYKTKKNQSKNRGRLETKRKVSISITEDIGGPVSGVTGSTSRGPRMHCTFHSGQLIEKVWTCCGGKATDPPCEEREAHISKSYKSGEIEALWQYHLTPSDRKPSLYRQAVAIDCEMGTARSGDPELIRVTMLDYFSGQVLLDRLVNPDIPMLHLNTRFSGIRWADMEHARRTRTCLRGRHSAREAILQFVGPSTVVIGHAVHNDMTSLRWIHPAIVDTYILEAARIDTGKADGVSPEANLESLILLELQDQDDDDLSIPKPDPSDSKEEETLTALKTPSEASNRSDGQTENKTVVKKNPKGSGRLSLKTLARVRLGREIQTGRKGHDSVEDALATRDLLHAYIISQEATAMEKPA